jgi:hypothetical protein
MCLNLFNFVNMIINNKEYIYLNMKVIHQYHICILLTLSVFVLASNGLSLRITSQDDHCFTLKG